MISYRFTETYIYVNSWILPARFEIQVVQTTVKKTNIRGGSVFVSITPHQLFNHQLMVKLKLNCKVDFGVATEGTCSSTRPIENPKQSIPALLDTISQITVLGCVSETLLVPSSMFTSTLRVGVRLTLGQRLSVQNQSCGLIGGDPKHILIVILIQGGIWALV